MNFVNLKGQYQAYKNEIDAELQKVLDTTSFINGPAVSELEEGLKNFVGTKYAVACSSGTDAILMALMALGVKAGDEVIVPCFSFFATAEMISLIGAKPIFVDIEPKTYNIDVSEIERKITPKTKAIMPVALYGLPADMDEINLLADKHGIPVIEDAAQSFGALYKGKRSCNLSKIGMTSFFPSKPLGCYGDGGALLLDDEKLYQSIKMIRDHGSAKRYYHEIVGINGRLDSMQAAVLNVKLKRLQKELDARQERANVYTEFFKKKGLETPVVKDVDKVSAVAQYTIEVENRDDLQKKLQEKGIPTAVHYPLGFHELPVYKKEYGDEKYPVTERVSRRVLSLPICAFLSEEDQMKVVKALDELL